MRPNLASPVIVPMVTIFTVFCTRSVPGGYFQLSDFYQQIDLAGYRHD